MDSKGHEIYRFTIRTPVHVGTGEKLGKTDIAPQGGQWIVVDMESVFSQLQNNPSAFDAFEERNFSLSGFLRKHRISPGNVQKYTLANPDNIRFDSRTEVQEMIKTGMGKPIIPGSSIKGALRTVIWWHLVRSKDIGPTLDNIIGSRAKSERADDALDKELFGKNPNYDFMRALQVGDTEFALPDIRLVESRVLNLTSTGSGWKKMGRNGFTTPDPKKATPLYCEALNPKAMSTSKMKVDEFLFDDLAQGLGFSGKKELLTHLPERCNQFARNFIAGEIEFFKSCNMREMVKFYQELQAEIPDGNDVFLLHLGWGSGWRGMTGNYIEPDMLKKLRVKFRLGKRNFPEFPKTRKIAFQNRTPEFPFGWIRVEKVSQDEITASAPKPSPPKPKKSEFAENFDKFRVRPSPEHFAEFAGKIKPEESGELENISFKGINGVNIGYAGPFLACDLPDEIRKTLARKLLEVIKKNKRWNADKLENYKKLKNV